MFKFDKYYSEMSKKEKIEFYEEASEKTLLIMILDTLQRMKRKRWIFILVPVGADVKMILLITYVIAVKQEYAGVNKNEKL